jgi:hypothetical protein
MYFSSLEIYWPQLLETLRDEVAPNFKTYWVQSGSPQWKLPEPVSNLSNDPARQRLLAALQNWASRFGITEDWIIQTAFDTLQIYTDSTPPLVRPTGANFQYWLYVPIADSPSFKPTFEQNFWYPSPAWGETWSRFKKRMESTLSKELNAYRRTMEMQAGIRKQDTLLRDAIWTVRYQKGEAAFEIAADLTNYDDAEQTVYRAVERFARMIGLNLRKTRKRRPRK